MREVSEGKGSLEERLRSQKKTWGTGFTDCLSPFTGWAT